MPSTPFTEADVRRAVRGAIRGGMGKFVVEADVRGGVIRLVPVDALPKREQSAEDDDRWFGDES